MGGPEKHIAEAEVETISKDVAVGNVVELVSPAVNLPTTCCS